MKKILVIPGIQAEEIKPDSLINELKRERALKIFVCMTGQHKEMVEPALRVFNLKIDYNLKLFTIGKGRLSH